MRKKEIFSTTNKLIAEVRASGLSEVRTSGLSEVRASGLSEVHASGLSKERRTQYKFIVVLL
jgi:hypothetical protein